LISFFLKKKSAKMSSNNFKVMFIGESNAGKDAVVQRLATGKYVSTHSPTLGVSVEPVTLHTNLGELTLNCWSCAGLAEYGGLRDGYYINSQAAVIVFDAKIGSPISLAGWTESFVRVCGAQNLLFIVNKIDLLSTRKLVRLRGELMTLLCSPRFSKMADVSPHHDHVESVIEDEVESTPFGVVDEHSLPPNIGYFEVSCKTVDNFDAPWRWLARRLTANESVELVSLPSMRMQPIGQAEANEEEGEEEHESAAAAVAAVDNPFLGGGDADSFGQLGESFGATIDAGSGAGFEFQFDPDADSVSSSDSEAALQRVRAAEFALSFEDEDGDAAAAAASYFGAHGGSDEPLDFFASVPATASAVQQQPPPDDDNDSQRRFAWAPPTQSVTAAAAAAATHCASVVTSAEFQQRQQVAWLGRVDVRLLSCLQDMEERISAVRRTLLTGRGDVTELKLMLSDLSHCYSNEPSELASLIAMRLFHNNR
jgi:GTPase SAR1 family protein